MIPVDLFSLIVGMALGAGIYWMATHVDRWLDTSFEDEKKLLPTEMRGSKKNKYIRGNYTTTEDE